MRCAVVGISLFTVVPPAGKGAARRFGSDARLGFEVRRFSGYAAILLFLSILFEDRWRLSFAIGVAGGCGSSLQDVLPACRAFSIVFQAVRHRRPSSDWRYSR